MKVPDEVVASIKAQMIGRPYVDRDTDVIQMAADYASEQANKLVIQRVRNQVSTLSKTASALKAPKEVFLTLEEVEKYINHIADIHV